MTEFINDINRMHSLHIRSSFIVPATVSILLLLLLASSITTFSVFAQNQSQLSLKQGQQEQEQPNIRGSNIYQTQKLVLGKNIKNLVILVPNEGHEYPNATPKELRIINQPYVPQNAIVNIGTTVTWLNADAGHHHSIDITDRKGAIVYTSGFFNNANASKPFTFNNLGSFSYSGPSYDKMWPNYKMNGTITVVNQPLATTFNNTAPMSSPKVSPNGTSPDTIATFMVPSNIADKTISDLKSKGFAVDNQYPFMSLRGGGSASGGDKQQVLLVLTSAGKSLIEVTSALSQVDATMTYK